MVTVEAMPTDSTEAAKVDEGEGSKLSAHKAGLPVHEAGNTDGSIKKGIGGKGSIIGIPLRPPDVWLGTRTQMYLPILAIRA